MAGIEAEAMIAPIPSNGPHAELEHRQADEQLRGLREEMEVLLDVNRAIGRHLGRDELFGALAACLRNVFETDRFGIEPPSGSTREADTVQKVFKARVRAQRIEARPQKDARVKSLFVAFF